MRGLRVDRASDGVYYLTGELDAVSAAGLEAGVGLCSLHDEQVALDLRDLTGWDVTGIQAILRIAERPGSHRVLLIESPPNLVGWLNVLGLGRFRVREHDDGDSGWVLEAATRTVRETRTDGPGAWSRWVALRTTYESAARSHRELMGHALTLRERCAAACERARSLRRGRGVVAA
jgi:anti-anti-sigma regulatory factor